MFSEVARARMLQRGWRPSSLLMFVRDSAAEAAADMRRHRSQVRSMVAFAGGFYIATVALAVVLYGGAAVVSFAAWSALGVAAFTAWAASSVRLLRAPDGTRWDRVGLANYLTLSRFYLIAPVLVLFHDGHVVAALVTYIVLGLTDIVDGLLARVRREQSEFGVVFDPLADVFSTAALFAVFLAHDLVPLWLFLVLLTRYAVLFVGSFVLFLTTGPIRFKATLPGKVVGIIQGAGIVTVILCGLSGTDWLDRVGPFLFPVLGVSFASIIVSQLVIGARHLRGATKAVQLET